jgi:hypothetical protein
MNTRLFLDYLISQQTDKDLVLAIISKDCSIVNQILINMSNNYFNNTDEISVVSCYLCYKENKFLITIKIQNHVNRLMLITGPIEITEKDLQEIFESYDNYYFIDIENKTLNILDIIQTQELNNSAKSARIKK